MHPAPSVIELREGIGDERLREKEEKEGLGEDDNVVHLVHDAIGHVDTLQQNDENGEDVAYTRQPFFYVTSEGGLVVYAVDRVCRIETTCRSYVCQLATEVQDLSWGAAGKSDGIAIVVNR